MITQTISVPNASAQQVYDVLMNAEKHAKLIGDSADIEDREGADFSTFSGYSSGTNLELKPGKLIKQTWRASDWPGGHYSTITFMLEDSSEGASISFNQDNLPEGAEEEFMAGWEDNYWKPLKIYFS